MNREKMVHLVIGFIAGIFYLSACSGGGVGAISKSIADTIINAVDIVYDNTTSDLSSAGNVQSAIDELAAKVKVLESEIPVSSLVGNWQGKVYRTNAGVYDISLSLNADGTYACNGVPGAYPALLCDKPLRWTVIGKTIIFEFDVQRKEQVVVQMLNSTTLMYMGDGQDLYHLIK